MNMRKFLFARQLSDTEETLYSSNTHLGINRPLKGFSQLVILQQVHSQDGKQIQWVH